MTAPGGSSAAERKRRSRAHGRGDHSLCLSGRPCRNSAIPPDAPRDGPELQNGANKNGDESHSLIPTTERGPRGQRLWDEMADAPLSPGHRLLLDEACRIADRLDRLDGLIGKRKSWMSFETDDGGRVVVVVDAVLAEARQHATALRGLITEITRALPKAAAPAPPKRQGAGLADLVALADRRRSAAG